MNHPWPEQTDTHSLELLPTHTPKAMGMNLQNLSLLRQSFNYNVNKNTAISGSLPFFNTTPKSRHINHIHNEIKTKMDEIKQKHKKCDH